MSIFNFKILEYNLNLSKFVWTHLIESMFFMILKAYA